MVKPLSFKGEKKPKKRKHHESALAANDGEIAAVDTEEDDSWTMPNDAAELTGPTVIVLPTKPPTCLASDSAGNVYASKLENMVENDPKTAEPHSVQQVFVVSKVVGMASNEITLKASHGNYLSCDQYGALSARREARGTEESFTIDSCLDEEGRSWFQLQTATTKDKTKVGPARFLSAENVEAKMDKQEEHDDGQCTATKTSVIIRGDGDKSSDSSRIILRMQTRFKSQTAESKESARSREKISRQQLEIDAGRKLTDEDAKRLKRARRDGSYQEAVLDVRAKGKHDKYA